MVLIRALSAPNRAEGDRMRVVVDLDRCEANALCMGVAPEVFELTDDDELIVLQEFPDESLRDRVQMAVRQCPRQAIAIDDSSPGTEA